MSTKYSHDSSSGDETCIVLSSTPSSPLPSPVARNNSSLSPSFRSSSPTPSSDARKKLKLCQSDADLDQNRTADWDQVKSCAKEQVEKVLDEKKSLFDELKEKKELIDRDILKKQKLLEFKKSQTAEAERKSQSKMKQFSERKEKLRKEIEDKIRKLKEKAESLEDEIQNHMDDYQFSEFFSNHDKRKLLKEIQSLKLKREETKQQLESFKQFSIGKHETRKNLQIFIQDMVKDLECPVCMEESAAPIFSCMQMHVICSTCRDKVVGNSCPVCRGSYGLERMRHRFAEKISEKLAQLRKELEELDR